MTDTPGQNPSVETLDAGAAGLVSLLPSSAESAPPKQKGFDAKPRILAAVATTLATTLGYTFAIRYISRGATENPGDLSHDEAVGILNSRLALIAVQHVEVADWRPSAALGTQYGETAHAEVWVRRFPLPQPGFTYLRYAQFRKRYQQYPQSALYCVTPSARVQSRNFPIDDL